MKSLIVTVIISLIAFFSTEISFFNRIILVVLFLIASTSLAFSYGKNYLNKLSLYKIGYYVQVALLGLFSVYLIIYNYLPEHHSNYVTIPLASICFLLFICSSLYPLIRYWPGIKFYYPKTFRIPISGRKLELIIENRTPLGTHFDLKISLPDNVMFKKTDLSEYSKKLFIKAKSKLSVYLDLKSKQNRVEKTASISLETDLIGKYEESINVIT